MKLKLKLKQILAEFKLSSINIQTEQDCLFFMLIFYAKYYHHYNTFPYIKFNDLFDYYDKNIHYLNPEIPNILEYLQINNDNIIDVYDTGMFKEIFTKEREDRLIDSGLVKNINNRPYGNMIVINSEGLELLEIILDIKPQTNIIIIAPIYLSSITNIFNGPINLTNNGIIGSENQNNKL